MGDSSEMAALLLSLSEATPPPEGVPYEAEDAEGGWDTFTTADSWEDFHDDDPPEVSDPCSYRRVCNSPKFAVMMCR